MALLIFDTLIIFIFSIVPTEVFTTVLVISTDLSFGIIMASTPKASLERIIAPKL